MDKSFTPEMITPQWVALILIAGLLVLLGPRKYVLPTILVATAFLALENRMYIFGLNFFTARILLVFGWVRVLARGEHRGLQVRPLDKALILFSFWSVISETLLRGFPGTVYAVANHLLDALGTYFLVRVFLDDAEVLRQLIKTLCAICCVLGAFMMVELLTRHNWLAVLGAAATVQERVGRLRCQATFQHPVLAGTYGGVLLPLFAACWWQPRLKALAITGCLASMIMILTAGSGGPLMTLAAVLVGFFMWPMRNQMRLVRWGILFTLLALHLVMNAPVWSLIARLQVVPGASSYHRYILIDAFVTHVRDWWLIGVEETGSWGWFTDDVANYFCVVCKHAGLLGLGLFIRLLAAGFREVGVLRRDADVDGPTEILLWAFGISLFAHVVSFWGTSYFDQTIVLWHFTLAMLASLSLLTQPQELSAEALDEETSTETGLEQPLPAN